ncbi:MAG: HD domain-containing protein [Elusimicrobia bacterium]|nr:HD domain-containing protein [Elusimicrobiota bacterium]
MLLFDDIKNDKELITYLKYSDEIFASMGYKKHGINHALYTAQRAGFVLEQLGYTKRMQELAKIAGYLHDIGNIISRKDHARSSAFIAMAYLGGIQTTEEKYNGDVFEVFNAIGSHEDKETTPPTEIAAAVVLGDRTDVRSERLRSLGRDLSDVHSKVIAACRKTNLEVSKEKKEISLWLDIDTEICSIMEYFEIFLQRTFFCSRACETLKCKFALYINGDKFL